MIISDAKKIFSEGEKICDWAFNHGKKYLVGYKRDYYLIITNENDLILEGERFDKAEGGFILNLIRIYEKKIKSKHKSIFMKG